MVLRKEYSPRRRDTKYDSQLKTHYVFVTWCSDTENITEDLINAEYPVYRSFPNLICCWGSICLLIMTAPS